MVYDLTKNYHQKWMQETVENHLKKVFEKFKNKRELDIHNEISTKIAIELLCKALGNFFLHNLFFLNKNNKAY